MPFNSISLTMTLPRFNCIIDYEDPYVQPLILEALKSQLPRNSYARTSPLSDISSKDTPLLQFRAYEALDFEHALQNPTSLINAYIIRKALIRKHYLSHTIWSWVTKQPCSPLKRHFKPAVDFEVDYAEFLDDALVEAYELRESFARNERKQPSEREWWILKPGMSDRGQGIRLFSTEEELQAIFEGWELENSEDEAEGEEEDDDHAVTSISGSSGTYVKGDGIITSHLRHFVAQPYIHPPLLIPSAPFNNRKFHVRTYVVAVGALRVYVCNRMLALFASERYIPPWESQPSDDIGAVDDAALERIRNIHLTNTCVQTKTGITAVETESVFLLSSLPLPKRVHASIRSQIHETTSELFRAAAALPTNFQPLPQCFELYGVDFLVEDKGVEEDVVNVQLLEVNAFPDFAQTGEELSDVVVKGLFEELFRLVIGPYFGVEASRLNSELKESGGGFERLAKVLDIDLGRR